MFVETKALGKVEIDERQKISFPFGLFGFEKMVDFAILDATEKPFYWLQSLQDSSLAFLLVDPFLFCSNYELDVDNQILKEIGILSPNEILVFSIVTVPADGSDVTANLQGPVIVNKANKKARQVIVDDPRWHCKHSILDELKKGKKVC